MGLNPALQVSTDEEGREGHARNGWEQEWEWEWEFLGSWAVGSCGARPHAHTRGFRAKTGERELGPMEGIKMQRGIRNDRYTATRLDVRRAWMMDWQARDWEVRQKSVLAS